MIPCFEPVLTIAHGVPCSTIAGAKTWTPLTTPQRFVSRILPPALRVGEEPAAALPPGVVHQQRDLAEGGVGPLLEALDLLAPADVGRHGQHVRPARRPARDQGRGGVERGGVHVGHDDPHAEGGEALRGGEADAAGGAGDHGDAAGGEGGMLRHGASPPGLRVWRP